MQKVRGRFQNAHSLLRLQKYNDQIPFFNFSLLTSLAPPPCLSADLRSDSGYERRVDPSR